MGCGPNVATVDTITGAPRLALPVVTCAQAGVEPVAVVAEEGSGPKASDQVWVVRELSGTSGDVHIMGEVRVNVGEVSSVRAWLQVLPDPRVLACRDQDTGARHVEMRAGHSNPAAQEVITVYWRCPAKHPLWETLLTGRDLAPGTEREINSHVLLKATSHLQIVPAPFG